MAVQPPSSIVILTGAGISRESGLHTFRDAGGVWTQVRLEDVATPEAFARDPARVHAFYNERRRRLLSGDIAPNPAHYALADLEARWPGEVLVVTQNIDNLHERAGSRNLVHMHGEMLKARCTHCGNVVRWADDIRPETACPACALPGTLRPHVTWFGEVPMELDRIFAALDRCDLFLAVGTSGAVYPAAGFVQHVRAQGRARTVELNLEPSARRASFDEAVHGPASRVVPEFVSGLLERAA